MSQRDGIYLKEKVGHFTRNIQNAVHMFEVYDFVPVDARLKKIFTIYR